MLNARKLRQAFILGLVIAASASPIAIVHAGTDSWTGFGVGGKTVNAFATIPNFPPPILWVGTNLGVFTNMGGSWIQLGTFSTNALVIGPPPSYPFYAGTDTGVYKSTDSGGTWSPSNTGLTNTIVMALAINPATPTTLYAGTYGGGVFKSTNSGGTWSAVNSGLTDHYIRVLAINPSSSATLYAGTDTDLFKSTDGGGSWSDVSTGGTPYYIWSLAIDPVTPAIIYAGTIAGVYRSANGGGSWSAINSGLTYPRVQALAIDPATPTTIYAGTYAGGVFKSWNSGQTWHTFHTGLTDVYSLLIDPSTPADVYAGTNSGVFDIEQTPDPFGKNIPGNGVLVHTNPTLSWGTSSGAESYEYCVDIVNNSVCDGSWVSAGSNKSASLSGLNSALTYYWQVRAINANGTAYATGGNWWSFTTDTPTFADVPFEHPFWAYIQSMYNSGITTGCGTGPLIYCPNTAVTRAAMAVFLLRAKHGSSYTPPAASHYFSDLPVAGKEWMEPWVDEFYREGISGGCGTGPLVFCPETSTTRAAMAVFILRAKYGSSYTPPAASHFFIDLPVAGKEWMEPWVDELYREGITTGCGTGPLIYCPETAVKRQAMAAFIVRAFNLPMP
jgi:hypothetical protein